MQDDAVLRSELPSVRRADAILSGAVRLHTMLAIVRLCAYTLVVDALLVRERAFL